MLKNFRSKDYLLKPGKKAHLKKRDTDVKKLYDTDEEFEARLSHLRKEISDRQEVLYADRRFGVIVIFQGMDASGKDGAIKHIMSSVNPQGVSVSTFAAPSEEERQHDFLWRTHLRTPTRGKIGIFNRSYYEEVTTVRVHPEYLKGEGLIADGKWDSEFWTDRCDSIANYETALTREGYRIIKFYLHISRDEQKERLLARIDEAEKNWKFDPADMIARQNWNKYQEAYEDALSLTSSKSCPWYVIPADDKHNARLMMSHILLEHLKELPLRYPRITDQQREELQKIAKKLR